MANQNSKKKTNTNNKKNTTKKNTPSKNTNKKEVKKVVTNEKVKEVKIPEKKEPATKVEKVTEKKVEVPTVKKEKKSFKLTSKQRDIVLVLLVAVVLVIALVLTGDKTPKFEIELPVALEGTTGFNEITYSEYEEKLAVEEPFLVVIVNDGCGYCEAYEPVVKEVADEYNLPISYINLANLSQEEKMALVKSNSYLKKQPGLSTPTTLFMYGKNVVDTISGYVDKDTFLEFVKENFVVEDNE